MCKAQHGQTIPHHLYAQIYNQNLGCSNYQHLRHVHYYFTKRYRCVSLLRILWHRHCILGCHFENILCFHNHVANHLYLEADLFHLYFN